VVLEKISPNDHVRQLVFQQRLKPEISAWGKEFEDNLWQALHQDPLQELFHGLNKS